MSVYNTFALGTAALFVFLTEKLQNQAQHGLPNKLAIAELSPVDYCFFIQNRS